MPIQTAKASMGYAKGHITANLWLWIAVFAAITAIAALLRWNAGNSGTWGDVMAFAGMVAGILVVFKSQEGFVSHHGAPASEGTIEGSQV
jgi:hypothetical protein